MCKEQGWAYNIRDVLLIERHGAEVLARVAGPCLVNLRVSGGLRWGARRVKIQPEQIIRPLPNWERERKQQWEAELKTYADAAWAKMSPAQQACIHQQALQLGVGRDIRSPLDILIDRVCGRE